MFFEKRTKILFFDSSVALLIASILYFGDRFAGFTLNNWLILLVLALHAGFSFLPRFAFHRPVVTYSLVLVNLGGAWLAFARTGLPGSLYNVLLFVVLLVGATGRQPLTLLAGAVLVSLAYPASLYLAGWPVEDVSWLATLLLADFCLFCGYLAYLQRAHEERVEAGTVYTTDLFEFGKILARADDPDVLHSRIPRLVADIMNADNCELALVEEDRIARRVLPNRHCRDFVGLELSQSVHQRTLASPDIYVSLELQEDPFFSSKKDFSLYPYKTYMGRAWTVQGRPAGLLALYAEKKAGWNEFSKKKFQFLVDQSVVALQNARLRQELEAQARSDGLTGLANHRYFYERLEEEFARAKRKNHFLSVALIDLDHFKRVNDSAGHRVGDQILQALSGLLKASIRRMDLAGRLGGDEFCVALPETAAGDASTLCQRILQAAAKLKVADHTGFSLSIGCATFPQDGETLNEIVEHADQALYHSKNLGRGRVSRYSDVRLHAQDQAG